MERLTARSPAGWTDCLDMGGSRAYTRKALLWQRSIGDSIAIDIDGELAALAFLCVDDQGRRELAMGIKPEAASHMLALCRFAHLTLSSIAETGSVIVCHVKAGNRQGERMARLVGFTHAEDTIWIFNGARDEQGFQWHLRGRRQGRGQGGGREPAAAAGGERSAAAGAEHQ